MVIIIRALLSKCHKLRTVSRPILECFDDCIDALGGTTEAARIVGCKAPNICHWRTRRGRFPAAYFLVITEALAERGYAAAMSLFDFERPRGARAVASTGVPAP